MFAGLKVSPPQLPGAKQEGLWGPVLAMSDRLGSAALALALRLHQQ